MTMKNNTNTLPARLRGLVLLAAIGMLASACVSSEPPVSDAAPVVLPVVTTQPETPPEELTEENNTAIEDYWDARNAAFAAGAEAGLAFVVANNHPLLTYTVDDCRESWFDGEIPVGFSETNDLVEGSVESDTGWTMVSGPLAGRDLGQGLVNMVVSFTYEGQLLRVADRVSNVHLQVNGDDVRHFLLCEDAEVIVASSTTTQSAAAPIGTLTTTPTTTPTGTTGGTTPATTAPVTPVTPATLPPITATSSPGGGGTGGGTTNPTPTPTPTEPENCSDNGAGFAPSSPEDSNTPGTEDYTFVPECGPVDNSTGEDGGLDSEPELNP